MTLIGTQNTPLNNVEKKLKCGFSESDNIRNTGMMMKSKYHQKKVAESVHTALGCIPNTTKTRSL